MKRFFVPLLIIATSLSSCEFMDRTTEQGNGNISVTHRNEKHFKGVKTFGDFEVRVTSGSDYAVKVEADENLQQFIRTSVEDNTLEIKTEDGVSIDPTSTIKVDVTAPLYDQLATSGSGDIKGVNQLATEGHMHIDIAGSGDIEAEIKADDVHASISGSGTIKVSGQSSTFKASITGDGDVEADKLNTEEASIEINGSGNTLINASKKLDIHISGSGDVKYSGNPQINQQINGSGNIEKVD